MGCFSTCTHPISQINCRAAKYALCRNDQNESATQIWRRLVRAGFLVRSNADVGMLRPSVLTLVESVLVVDSPNVDDWLSSSAERRTEVISMESSSSWAGREAAVLIDHPIWPEQWKAVQQADHVHRAKQFIVCNDVDKLLNELKF
jgi:hypothetical protein